MDDGRPKVAAESAVMTVGTREVGTAWAMRSLGIALAFCMCLTVGGGFDRPRWRGAVVRDPGPLAGD